MNDQTMHAPAERSNDHEIGLQSKEIESHLLLQQTLNSLPFIAAIINQERQIIYSNDQLLKTAGIDDLNEVIGKRTGEALHCIHAAESAGGCGTSEACRYCGAVNAILECQNEHQQVRKICHISSNVHDKIIANEFEITASPIKVNENSYIILYLKDISSERRRLVLEKTFFHDVINTAGSLKGLIQVLDETDDPEIFKTLLEDIDIVSTTLLDEITAQRDLLAAERGDLTVEQQIVSSLDVCSHIVSQYTHHAVSSNKTVAIDPESRDTKFISDIRLLRRVIGNMVKNALEATAKNGKVTVSTSAEEEHVVFRVHNSGFISREVQLQMFQRSFSTKGKNRGIGTYSMRLIGESYLGGKIFFETSETSGTTFYGFFPFRTEI